MSASSVDHETPLTLQAAQVAVRDFYQPETHHVRSEHLQPNCNSGAAEDLDNLPSYQEARRFGNHKSEAEYLAALRAWVEEKQYIDSGSAKARGLVGFYGHTTLEEERQKADEARRTRKEERLRRKGTQEQQRVSDHHKSARGDGESGKRGLVHMLARRKNHNV